MRMLSFIIFSIMVGWVLGLAVFVHSLPSKPMPATVKTDAIIVLTGGSARVERGFTMLAEGAAPVLLISGVGKNVTVEEMLREHANESTRAAIRARKASVFFDYVALTTRSNARETAEFVRARNIRSVRLITADYHMPRSLAEMRAVLPNVEIVPDAVSPDGFRRDQWWKHETSRELVLSEFHKYLAVLARPVLKHLR